MSEMIDEAALGQIFTQARTHNAFLDRPVPDELLRKAVDIAKIGPTSANQSPLRIVFLKSKEAKARLMPAVYPGNAGRLFDPGASRGRAGHRADDRLRQREGGRGVLLR